MTGELRHQLNEIRAGLERAIAGADCAQRAAREDPDFAAGLVAYQTELRILRRRLDSIENWFPQPRPAA